MYIHRFTWLLGKSRKKTQTSVAVFGFRFLHIGRMYWGIRVTGRERESKRIFLKSIYPHTGPCDMKIKLPTSVLICQWLCFIYLLIQFSMHVHIHIYVIKLYVMFVYRKPNWKGESDYLDVSKACDKLKCNWFPMWRILICIIQSCNYSWFVVTNSCVKVLWRINHVSSVYPQSLPGVTNRQWWKWAKASRWFVFQRQTRVHHYQEYRSLNKMNRFDSLDLPSSLLSLHYTHPLDSQASLLFLVAHNISQNIPNNLSLNPFSHTLNCYSV